MSEATGPVRWRVTLAGHEPSLYSDRRWAVAAAKLARLEGHAVTLTMVATVARRWRVGAVRCYVRRELLPPDWAWYAMKDGVGIVSYGQRESYQEAVEAAERAARGQR